MLVDPTFLRGIASHWAALQKWNLDYILSLHPDAVVTAAVSNSNEFSGDARRHENVSMALADLFSHDVHEDGKVYYLAQTPIFSRDEKVVLHRLMDDIEIPEQVPAGLDGVCHVNLWISFSNVLKSTLHFDAHDNILCCIAGRKVVELFPTEEGPLLGLQSLCSPSPQHCNGEIAMRSNINPTMKVELGPGDGLFIPDGWLHRVESYDNAISVNIWWPGHCWRKLGLAAGEDSRCCARTALNPPELPQNVASFEFYVCKRLMTSLLAKHKKHRVERFVEECRQRAAANKWLENQNWLRETPTNAACAIVAMDDEQRREAMMRACRDDPEIMKAIMQSGVDADVAEALTLAWENPDNKHIPTREEFEEMFERAGGVGTVFEKLLVEKETFALETMAGLSAALEGRRR